jgi:hypothetical protein
MLVLDTGTQQNWQRAAKAETNAAQRQANLAKEILSNTISVDDDAGRDTSNLLAQMGRPLASIEVQRRLKLVCPNLIFERSIKYPDQTGIYIDKDVRNAAGCWEKKKIFLCGMESGVMPEMSVRHKAKKQVANPEVFGKDAPTREIDWLNVDTFAAETRGWRTVLVRLMHLEMLTRADVEKHFGWTPSVDSRKWYDQTR